MGRMKLAAIAAATVVLLAGCSPRDESSAKRLAMPVAGSEQADIMWYLWLAVWISVLVVFVVVFGMIMYAPIRYRRKNADDPAPPQIRYHLPLEVLYTIAPVILVSVFFFHTVKVQDQVVADEPNPDHTIEVVGSKWEWTFNYLDPEATDGVGVFDIGTPEELPSLYLPVNETVRFEMHSPDVIHSFWIPEFYYKLDVVPGVIPGVEGPSNVSITPNRKGVFTGRCAELCGTYHSRMMFKVHVVDRAEYDAHLKELKEAGQVGRPKGHDDAMTVVGLEADGEKH